MFPLRVPFTFLRYGTLTIIINVSERDVKLRIRIIECHEFPQVCLK